MPKIILPENLSPEVNLLLEKMTCKEALTREFLFMSLRNVKLFDNKQQDYGPRNISEFGFFGCIVRGSDKFARLKNLTNPMQKRRRAVNESVIDSLDDASNYMIIAKMCHEGIWPK